MLSFALLQKAVCPAARERHARNVSDSAVAHVLFFFDDAIDVCYLSAFRRGERFGHNRRSGARTLHEVTRAYSEYFPNVHRSVVKCIFCSEKVMHAGY